MDKANLQNLDLSTMCEGACDPEDKVYIDNLSYEELLRIWRFAKSGDPLLSGGTGKYFAKVMQAKRKEIGDEEHVRINKSIRCKT